MRAGIPTCFDNCELPNRFGELYRDRRVFQWFNRLPRQRAIVARPDKGMLIEIACLWLEESAIPTSDGCNDHSSPSPKLHINSDVDVDDV